MLYALGRTTYGRLGRADVDATADAAVHELGAVAGLEECAPVAGAAGGLAVSGCFGGPEGRLWLWGMGGPLQGNGDEEDDCLTPQVRRLGAVSGRQRRPTRLGQTRVALRAARRG